MNKKDNLILTGKIHVVFGESARKALLASKELAALLGPVIDMTDDLTVGPISDLERSIGRTRRKSWFTQTMACLETASYFNSCVENDYDKIQCLKEELRHHQEIYIWCGRTTYDILLTARIVYHLEDDYDKLIILKIPEITFTSTYGQDFTPDSLGVLNPEEVHLLTKFFEKTSKDRCSSWIQLWLQLEKENGLLRITKSSKGIETEDPSYFDELLLSNCTTVFSKATRVIGKSLIDVNFEVTDAFLNWRLLDLVKNKALEIKGTPTCIREYEVKHL